MKRAGILIALSILMLFSACKKEDTKNVGDSDVKPIDRGSIEVNSFYLVFQEDKPNGLIDTFYYSAANPKVADTIQLLNTKSYIASIHFFDKSGGNVNSNIESNEIQYQVCYKPDDPSDLRLTEVSKDKNGNNFGLSSKWITYGLTNANEHHFLNISFRYLPLKKDNTCSAGVQLLNANMLYLIKN